jgi:hypothetical protein
MPQIPSHQPIRSNTRHFNSHTMNLKLLTAEVPGAAQVDEISSKKNPD